MARGLEAYNYLVLQIKTVILSHLLCGCLSPLQHPDLIDTKKLHLLHNFYSLVPLKPKHNICK